MHTHTHTHAHTHTHNIHTHTLITYTLTHTLITFTLTHTLITFTLTHTLITFTLTTYTVQANTSPSTTRKLDSTADMERLREIFFQLQEVRDDSQQRGWAVHDDQNLIMEYLSELLQILVRGEGEEVMGEGVILVRGERGG